MSAFLSAPIALTVTTCFNRSTRSSPRTTPEMWELEYVVKQAYVLHESFYHTTWSSGKILGQDAKIMNAWTQALEYCDRKAADSVDKGCKIEAKELELDPERAKSMEFPTQHFPICSKAKNVTAAEMEKPIFHCNATYLAWLVEHMLIDALHAGYVAPKEGVKTPLPIW